MPVFVCSGCSSKLNAPDSVAGKKIKCPKCGDVCAVPVASAPAFEVVDKPPPPTGGKPTAKATGTDAEGRSPRSGAGEKEGRARDTTKTARDESDAPPRRKKAAEDDRGRPRKRAGGRKRDGEKAGSSGLLVVGILTAVVLTVGGAFAAYWFGFRGKGSGPDGGLGGEAVALDNWENYSAPDNTFKAAFPGKPTAHPWSPLGDFKVRSDIRQHSSGEKGLGKPGVAFFAGYVRFPNNIAPSEIANAKKWLITLHAAPDEFTGAGKTFRKVTAGGREWDEERMAVRQSVGVVRWHQAGSILHLVGYRCESQPPPTAAVDKFFAEHQVLGGDPGDPEPDPVKLDNW
ncbi:MAG: hypothetical protein K2V38_06655, partial [Gemmataceae bacterium]|nr:hypothetical protein [Gemmataceae bacterium]